VYALEDKTVNISEVYNTILNITVSNAYTGQNLSNFTGWVQTTGYNTTYNSTPNKSKEIPLILGNYTVFANHPHYSINVNTSYANITLNETYHALNFGLYSNNSILINIRDEDTLAPITANISITITGNATENTYYTTNGTLYRTGLIDGNYTIKFSGTNYSTKTYTITVADRSYQTLTAYLSQLYEQATFTIINDLTGETVEGVNFLMERLINASWVTVENKQSDITGRVQVNYINDVRYKFTVSLAGYTTKLFYLDPVIFSSYNVRIDPILTETITQDYAQISVIYYPTVFYDDEVNNFTFTITSPAGQLENYTVNITFPWGNVGNQGSQALGETFTFQLNITGASLYDFVYLNYSYDSVLTTEKRFTRTFAVTGGTINQTWANFPKQDYGLGLFEKVLIATITILILAGVTFLVAGLGGSLLIGLLGFGFFVYVGFLPLWSILISLVVGFVILMKMGSNQ
jgi:hypothetical protein